MRGNNGRRRERERERETDRQTDTETERSEKGSEFMGLVRPNNDNKYELSCKSNFSKYLNTCI